MNLFDPGISKQLQASNIDAPSNAMTLCIELHKRFGDLKWYLEEVPVSFCLPFYTILYYTIGTNTLPPGHRGYIHIPYSTRPPCAAPLHAQSYDHCVHRT